MILAAVEIENYKQYAGSHCIDFPEQGMVAITGPNGAGKTTLFEAIEWCLYGPHTIPHASIPPHDGVGATRVSVTLQDPHDGRRYVVRRTLRNGVSSAEAYSEDDPGQPVVQGPRDVSDFVARQLVDLGQEALDLPVLVDAVSACSPPCSATRRTVGYTRISTATECARARDGSDPGCRLSARRRPRHTPRTAPPRRGGPPR